MLSSRPYLISSHFIAKYRGRFTHIVLGLIVWLLSTLTADADTANTAYDMLIGTTARQHGMEPALVKAVVKCESNFNPAAISPRGAAGLMQLMPATQTILGVVDAFDSQQNIDAGVRYLAMLQATFQADDLLIAAYNAGPQAVIDAGYQVPPFRETQRYLACVLAARQRYRATSLNTSFPISFRRISPKLKGLVVQPMQRPSRSAQSGQRFLLRLQAINTSTQIARGVISLTYPATTLSLLALKTTSEDTTVQLPSALQRLPVSQSDQARSVYQLLQGTWLDWQPRQPRSAVLVLVPSTTNDIALHISIRLYPSGQTTTSHRWSTVLRIPVQDKDKPSTPNQRENRTIPSDVEHLQ